MSNSLQPIQRPGRYIRNCTNASANSCENLSQADWSFQAWEYIEGGVHAVSVVPSIGGNIASITSFPNGGIYNGSGTKVLDLIYNSSTGKWEKSGLAKVTPNGFFYAQIPGIGVLTNSGASCTLDFIQYYSGNPIVIVPTFTETDLSDIITYLNVANHSSITESGGSFVSATDSNAPTTNNGWEDCSPGTATTYDDANDRLIYVTPANRSQIRVETTATGMPATNAARTFCVAFRSDYNNSAFQYLLYRNTADYFLLESNRFKLRTSATTYQSTSTVPNIDDQQNHILIVRSDSTNFTEVRIDGNVIAGPWSSFHAFNWSLETLCFWAYAGNSTNTYAGDLFKIIITTSRMSDTDVADLETKWLNDYGI